MIRRLPYRSVVVLGCLAATGLAAWSFKTPSELTNLVYATPDGAPLTLDLDLPDSTSGPFPVVLFAPPDGEWPRLFKKEPRYQQLLELLTRNGYAVATIHYREPGKSAFPSQLEDGKAAVRWLRANAAQYGLDGSRIGAMGVSQGGWGVAMLGTTGPDDGFEGAGESDISSRVQAVVGLGVPADFAAKNLTRRVEYDYLRPFLGAGPADDPVLYERASPGAYASADDPPFLLFHSREDLVVPIEMARTFARRLERAGVPVTLIEEEGMDHVWSGPKLDRLLEQTLAFFDRHLKR